MIVLGVLLAAAAALRLHDLDFRTLNHPEVYAPGIDLPWGLSNPNPRFSLWQTLAGSIAGEPHPPGYYILMLGWTKLFGSSLVALRLPSVLFGIASVLLVYALGRKVEGRSAALIAAGMLALNGLHLELSQTARMYSMACFLGLASTLLLADLAGRSAQPGGRSLLYVLVTTAGLATHVYVWPLFLTQILWVVAADLRERASLTGLLRLQVVTWILATPLIAIALYQSGHSSRPETLNPALGLLAFLQGGALFPTVALDFPHPGLMELAAAVALVVTLILLTSYALMRRGQNPEPPLTGRVAAPPAWVTAGAGVLMTLGILLFALVAKRIIPDRSISPILASGVLPLLLYAVDRWLARHPAGRRAPPARLEALLRRAGTLRSLPALLGIVPVGLVAGFSLANPILLERGTMVYAPYLLIVTGSGLAYLLGRDRRAVVLVLLLAGVHFVSLRYFQSRPVTRDFQTLAARWAPRVEDSDLIFVYGRGHRFDWEVAPIYYYMNARRYHYIGKGFAEAVRRAPKARVWVLRFEDRPADPEALAALSGRQARDRIEVRGVAAELYPPAMAITGTDTRDNRPAAGR